MGLLAETAESSNGTNYGLVSAALVATGLGLYVAHSKCRKSDVDFERV